jgi:hypothetical protein
MPIATVSQDAEKFQLKTAPPDGWVSLKRMTYGQKLTRSQTTTKMSILMRKGQKDAQGSLETLQMAAAMHDFRVCVVDHNLEDSQGRKLDFNSPQDVSTLDPRVGEEISTYIDKLNNFEEDDEEGNLPSASDKQS